MKKRLFKISIYTLLVLVTSFFVLSGHRDEVITAWYSERYVAVLLLYMQSLKDSILSLICLSFIGFAIVRAFTTKEAIDQFVSPDILIPIRETAQKLGFDLTHHYEQVRFIGFLDRLLSTQIKCVDEGGRIFAHLTNQREQDITPEEYELIHVPHSPDSLT